MRLAKLNPKPRDGRQAFKLIRQRVSQPMVAIYNVQEGHLECAPDAGDPRSVERKYGLDSCLVNQLRREVGDDAHVILAYDFENCEVYIIDAVKELQIASAVLTVLFADMFCGCQQVEKPCKCKDEYEDDNCWDEEEDDDDVEFDEFFDVTHAKNRDEDYLGGLKRLRPSFELTF
jgi:hypothetical protein